MFGLILMTACGEKEPENQLPTVFIASPEGGVEVLEGTAVEVRAELADAETPVEQLQVEWYLDGVEYCIDAGSNGLWDDLSRI